MGCSLEVIRRERCSLIVYLWLARQSWHGNVTALFGVPLPLFGPYMAIYVVPHTRFVDQPSHPTATMSLTQNSAQTAQAFDPL